MDDWTLLQQYVRDRSGEALNALVRRHLPLVYAAALRQTRDAHLADDVTQAVFVELMRNAPRLSSRVILGGWLFHATRFASRKALRSAWRRQRHEQIAAAEKPTTCKMAVADESAQRLRTLLDDAIAGLSGSDRDAVVLRYLEGKSCREVAEAQRINEDAARQRLSRALGKLRIKLGRKGLAVSEEVLGASLAGVALHAPPMELSARVLSAMRSSTGSPGNSFVSRIITMTKLHPIASACGALLITFGLGGILAHSAWSQPAPPAASVHPASSAAVAPSLSTPVDTFITALSAASAGDTPTFLTCFHDLTPEQTTTLQQISDCMGTGTELKKAVAARFGDNQANGLVMSLGFFPPIPPGAMRTAVPIINGNTAQLSLPGIGPVTFTKKPDGWKLDPNLLKNANTATHFKRLAPALPDLRAVIADINAGKYPTKHEVWFAATRVVVKADDVSPPADLPARPAILGPASDPKTTIAASIWASNLGNGDAAVSCFNDPTPEQREGILRAAKFGQVHHDLRNAIAETFGNMQSQRTLLPLGLETGLTGKLLAAAPETRDGNTAHIDLKGSAFPEMTLIQSAGLWKIDPKLIPPPNPQWNARFEEYYIPTFKQLAVDVKAGKYETPAQLQAAVAKLHTELKADHDRLVVQDGL